MSVTKTMWDINNSEKVRASKKRWRDKNKDYYKKYWQNYKEKLCKKNYRQENKEQIAKVEKK